MMRFVGAGLALASLAAVHGGASANEDRDAAYRAAACLTLQAYIDGEYDWLRSENHWVKTMSDRVGSSNSVVQKRALRADAVRRHLEFLKSDYKRLCRGSLKQKQAQAVCTTDDPELRKLTERATPCAYRGLFFGRR
ncbi:MAG: hypothetical protein RIC51_03690 [Erythrobacter sp.]